VGANYVGYHLNASHEAIVDLVNVNCTSMSVLTSRLIHNMSCRGNKSAIINLSSLAGDRGIPYLGLYSASKSFTNKFSEGLGYEYPKMDILSLRPVLVVSNLSHAK
jgi:short-subunit dehydrogenase